jgi:hypothetical protein
MTIPYPCPDRNWNERLELFGPIETNFRLNCLNVHSNFWRERVKPYRISKNITRLVQRICWRAWIECQLRLVSVIVGNEGSNIVVLSATVVEIVGDCNSNLDLSRSGKPGGCASKLFDIEILLIRLISEGRTCFPSMNHRRSFIFFELIAFPFF